MKKQHARGCCLVGEPAHYKKFGFEQARGLVYEGVPAKYFLVLPFEAKLPQGQVSFHPAFQAQS